MVRLRLLRLLGTQTGARDPSGDFSPPAPSFWPSPRPEPLARRPVARFAAEPTTGALPRDEPAAQTPGQDEPGRLPGPGAFDPGRRGVRALAVVAIVVVLGAAGWAWWSRPRAEPLAGAAATASGQDSAGAGQTGQSAAEGVPTSPSGDPELVVAVAGKVRRPGLVRLPAGARVADALEAAGGPLPGTDAALLNLARKVTDGELILVGVTAPPPAAGSATGATAGPAPAGGGVAGPGGKVNLNTATRAELETLPGVGPVLAQRIIDFREQRGGFRAISDLKQVTGIGDARYEDLKALVTL